MAVIRHQTSCRPHLHMSFDCKSPRLSRCCHRAVEILAPGCQDAGTPEVVSESLKLPAANAAVSALNAAVSAASCCRSLKPWLQAALLLWCRVLSAMSVKRPRLCRSCQWRYPNDHHSGRWCHHVPCSCVLVWRPVRCCLGESAHRAIDVGTEDSNEQALLPFVTGVLGWIPCALH